MNKESSFTTEAEKSTLPKQKIISSKSMVGASISINDLREREFGGEKLEKNEKLALMAFDKYRIAVLNKQENEASFHKKYLELQVMANLTPFAEFLKDSYMVL